MLHSYVSHHTRIQKVRSQRLYFVWVLGLGKTALRLPRGWYKVRTIKPPAWVDEKYRECDALDSCSSQLMTVWEAKTNSSVAITNTRRVTKSIRMTFM